VVLDRPVLGERRDDLEGRLVPAVRVGQRREGGVVEDVGLVGVHAREGVGVELLHLLQDRLLALRGAHAVLEHAGAARLEPALDVVEVRLRHDGLAVELLRLGVEGHEPLRADHGDHRREQDDDAEADPDPHGHGEVAEATSARRADLAGRGAGRARRHGAPRSGG